MRKKNLLTMGLGLMLTMVVVVGGTLAWLSSTDTITNTFTIGTGYKEDDDDHQGIWLDEEKVGTTTGERTDEDQTYPDMLPGKTVTKDPTAHMVGGSVASYVFIKVEGADALDGLTTKDKEGVKDIDCFTINGWNSNDWEKVAGADNSNYDGYYVYCGEEADDYIVDVSEAEEGSDVVLPNAIFQTVTMNSNVETLPTDEQMEECKIKVSAYAVQVGEDMEAKYLDALEMIINENNGK